MSIKAIYLNWGGISYTLSITPKEDTKYITIANLTVTK